MAYRYGKKIKDYHSWWEDDIEGSPEELQEEAEYQREYLYKLLDYSDAEEIPTPEELRKEKMRYQFARQGPRAWHFRLNPKNKLTSADVIYILTSTKASRRLAPSVGIADNKIREIRRGEMKCWEWEYDLVRRITAMCRRRVTSDKLSAKLLYVMAKMVEPGKFEDIYYATSKRKLEELRKDIMTKKEYEALEKKGLLDEVYPIRNEAVI